MSDLARGILQEIRSLEPFPEVALRVLQVSSRDDVVASDLVDVIQTDPGLTGKVLKLCNSAYYSFQREIATLTEAGNALGTATLVNLVLTSCSSRYFRDYGLATGKEQAGQWERSVANALAARVLASLRHEVDIERAYTAGLLQNIGSLVLERFLRDEQQAVRAELEHGAPLIEAERAVFGLSHAELGARLAARWNFPEILIDSIRHHHQPDQARVDPRLVEVMHVAESLCWAIGCGEGIDEVSYGVQASVVERLGMNAESLAGLKLLLGNEIRRAQDLVGIAA